MGDEEREPRLFTLTEAERTREQVEPLLAEAVETRRKMSGVGDKLGQLASRIMMLGGAAIRYDEAARMRSEHDALTAAIKAALEKIEAYGCVVKDLDIGLLDFPARIDNEDVYLCWRLGEDRIRFYHRQDEGFAGRKPLDPRDTGPSYPVH